jgi:hypothetical protein
MAVGKTSGQVFRSKKYEDQRWYGLWAVVDDTRDDEQAQQNIL